MLYWTTVMNRKPNTRATWAPLLLLTEDLAVKLFLLLFSCDCCLCFSSIFSHVNIGPWRHWEIYVQDCSKLSHLLPGASFYIFLTSILPVPNTDCSRLSSVQLRSRSFVKCQCGKKRVYIYIQTYSCDLSCTPQRQFSFNSTHHVPSSRSYLLHSLTLWFLHYQ